jgi:hypothetical protein
MRLVARWGLTVGVSAAAFALSRWLCQRQLGLDEGAALGVAGAVLPVAGWWTARKHPGGSPGAGGRRVVQNTRAGQDVNVDGCDQMVIYFRCRDE